MTPLDLDAHEYLMYVLTGSGRVERHARALAVLDQLDARMAALEARWHAYQQRTSWPQLSVYDVHIDPPTDR